MKAIINETFEFKDGTEMKEGTKVEVTKVFKSLTPQSGFYATIETVVSDYMIKADIDLGYVV